MSPKTAAFVLLLSVSVLGLRAGETPIQRGTAPGSNAFVHATYVVGSRIKNRAQLDATRFDQFNFMYVMAGPAWEAKDFDHPEGDVMKKFVLNHSYPAGDSGNALVPEFIARAQQKQVKVLLSMGGTDKFNPIAGNAKMRALFSRVMAAFIKKHNFDGIEIDWEHTVDIDQHTLLMADLRKALNAVADADGSSPKRYFLTTALQTYRTYSQEQAQLLCCSVDWVNIMTYDMGGGIWDRTARHNTPLNSMQQVLKKWSVFPPDKKDFITIDNNRSLSRKLEWVFKAQFRGVFWWEFHCDYFPPVSGQRYARHPLIDPVAESIKAVTSQ